MLYNARNVRFLSLVLISILFSAALYFFIVYSVNPWGQFSPSNFPAILTFDRRAKLQLFARFLQQAPPTGLVLGSSRSMKLRPQDLDRAFGGRFFNFAVTAATAEDDLSIYRWVHQRNVHPRYILIGLDVEALHSSDELNGSLLTVPELMTTLKGRSSRSVLERGRELLGQAKNIFTWAYFQDALTSIDLKLHPRVPAWSFDEDGYVHYRQSENERRLGTFDYRQAMSQCAVKYQKTYETMNGLSSKRRGYLETLIQEAQSDGAKVLIWLTPLHPDAKPTVEKGTRYTELVEQTNDYLAQLRDRFHIVTVDLHDPSAFRAADTYWYDCVHFDEPAADRLVAALLAACKRSTHDL